MKLFPSSRSFQTNEMLLRIRVGVKRMCVLRLNLVLPLLLSFSFSFCCGTHTQTHTLLGPMRWWLFSRKRSKIQIHDYVEMCYTMIQTFICFVSRLVYILCFSLCLAYMLVLFSFLSVFVCVRLRVSFVLFSFMRTTTNNMKKTLVTLSPHSCFGFVQHFY